MKHGVCVVVLVAGSVWVATPAAQSLGDIARQGQVQHERAAGKRYSDEDLSPGSAPRAPVVQSPRGLDAVSAGAEGPGTEKTEDVAEGAGDEESTAADADGGAIASAARDKRDETYWRTRAGAVKALVRRHSDDVTQLETRLASLKADTSAGAGRERQLTDQLLAKARRDLQSVLGEVDSLERDARAKKIPAEWIQ